MTPAGETSAMRRAAFVSWTILVALLLTACGSYRPVTPLDDAEQTELAGLATRLGATPVRVVVADPDHGDGAAIDVREGLRGIGVPIVPLDARPGAAVLTIEASGPYLESYCQSPIFVVTAGIVPEVDNGREEYRWRIASTNGRSETSQCAIDSPYFAGWLGFPVAVLPGWEIAWSGVGGHAPPGATRRRLALEVARSIDRFLAGAKGAP